MGSLFGGGGSQTVTQQTEVPQYIGTAQQNLIDTANRLTSPYLQNSPTQTVAGFNPDQNTAFDWARWMNSDAFSTPTQQVPQVSGLAQWMNPGAAQIAPASLAQTAIIPDVAQAQAPMATAATPAAASLASTTPATTANMQAAALGPASLVDAKAGQVGGADIRSLLNPYRQDVLDPTLAAMRRELDTTQNSIRARNASSAAFGGSRGALQASEANRGFGDQVALTTAGLMAKGYDQATATALANADSAQKAGIFNAGAQNTNNAQAAQFQQDANAANQKAANATSLFNAGADNAASQFNAGSQNAVSALAAKYAQDAALANQDVQARANQYNAGATNAARTFNYGAENTRNLAASELAQRTAQANQSATNAMNTAFYGQRNSTADADAGRALQAAGLQNTFANDTQRRQAAALQQLLGIGGQQQSLDQQQLNTPFDMFKLLGQATPMSNFGGSSTSQYPTQSNPIGSALGLTMAGNGLFGSSGLFPGAATSLFGGGGAGAGFGAGLAGEMAAAAPADLSWLAALAL